MSRESAVTLYQPMLYSIACRILGSVSDAEDVVQDTFVKWLTIDTSGIRNAKSYLIRTVTNNCLNHLDNLERRKNELLVSIPQFLQEKWDAHLDLEQEVTHALALIHQKLEPVERAVFVMREVFNLEYEEIQNVIQKKKENCRQLLHRAKKKLQQDDNAGLSAKDVRPGFINAFKSACQHGNLHELMAVLKGDIK